MSIKPSALSVAAAVAGALSLVAVGTATAQTKGAPGVKCYGVAKAGQNDCASAAGTHSCAGQSKADYDRSDWKAVASSAECAAKGGDYLPGRGMNDKAKK